MTKIALHGATDIGQVRQVNEDNFGLLPECNTLIVCDGMGGHAAGEVASQRAVETVQAYLTRGSELPGLGPLTPEQSSHSPEAQDLVWATRLANRRVFLTAQAQEQMLGMGTTLVVARFSEAGVTICHVGDSRAYHFHDGHLTQVTIDHSLVAELVSRNEITPEQARTFTERNIITRALGTRPTVAVDVSVLPAVQGDWILLCSDGLCGVLTDEEMENVLKSHSGQAEAAIAALILAANQAGGPDNITAAIAEVVEGAAGECQAVTGATVPESDEDTSIRETKYLSELFPPSQSAMGFVEETRTDRIPINLLDPPDKEKP